MNVKRDLCLHVLAVAAALILFFCKLDADYAPHNPPAACRTGQAP